MRLHRRRAQFHRIESQVASRGFRRDPDSEVICRWVHRKSGIVFDLMPVDPAVFGFSNRWYPYAAETAEVRDLGGGLRTRCATAVAFVATKLEAFASRGAGDVLGSHDLEDISTSSMVARSWWKSLLGPQWMSAQR